MKEENIIKAATKAGLDKDTTKIFVKFFSKRFPNEDDRIESYVGGWATRFKFGNPTYSMDGDSKAIYEEVKK